MLNINLIREAKGISPSEIAEVLEIPVEILLEKDAGTKEFTELELEKMADHLGLEKDNWLLDSSDHLPFSADVLRHDLEYVRDILKKAQHMQKELTEDYFTAFNAEAYIADGIESDKLGLMVHEYSRAGTFAECGEDYLEKALNQLNLVIKHLNNN